MLKFIKGDPENLEGRAIIFAANLSQKPFINNEGRPFFPAQSVFPTKEYPLELGGKTFNLKPSTIKLLKNFSGDVVYAGEISQLNYAISITKSAGNLYALHYISQQHKKKHSKEEPEIIRKDLGKLTKEEYQELLASTQRKAQGIFLAEKDPRKYIDELVYLAQNNKSINGDVAALSELMDFYLQKGDIADRKLLIRLYFIKISHIIHEEYEKAGEINKKIIYLLSKK
ncbi:hypothetical protein HYX16_02045 [Candidatus Woesearchaeota archaeon]|nr:hypothetical protein [Candidatus Woesearchaeota archaeon]